VQVAPGWHWQVAPHLQAGPQAQDFPSLLVATLAVVEVELTLLAVEFIACSVVW
jgi:hypothetical protein